MTLEYSIRAENQIWEAQIHVGSRKDKIHDVSHNHFGTVGKNTGNFYTVLA